MKYWYVISIVSIYYDYSLVNMKYWYVISIVSIYYDYN